MLARFSPALVVFAGSVLLLAGLIGTLYWIGADNSTPLEIYCAAAMRTPIEEIVKDYEKEFGQKVVTHFGASQTMLVNMELAKNGDLYMPADDSYIDVAATKDLITRVEPVARLTAVVIVRPGFGKEIKTWNDFLNAGKIGLANPEVAAISKLTREHLQKAGLWSALEAKKPSYLGDVNEVGNSVANVGSSDAGITWAPLALALQKKKPGLQIVQLDQLSGIEGHVQIAVAKWSTQPDNALRFIAFLNAADKGAVHLKKHGYTAWRGDRS